MRRLLGCFLLTLACTFWPVATLAELNLTDTKVYRLSLEINAHPSDVIPSLLNKKLWLDGYLSTTHLEGERWEVGEVVEIAQQIDGVTTRQREKILELEWEKRLTLQLSKGDKSSVALYKLMHKPKGVELQLLLIRSSGGPALSVQRGEVAERVRYNSELAALRIEHLQLKRMLERKAFHEMQK